MQSNVVRIPVKRGFAPPLEYLEQTYKAAGPYGLMLLTVMAMNSHPVNGSYLHLMRKRDLSRMAGMTTRSVTRIINELMDAGILEPGHDHEWVRFPVIRKECI